MLVDLALGEPPGALHPVNWIGGAIGALERAAPRSGRAEPLAYGAASTLALCGLATGAAASCAHVARRLPAPARMLALALLLKPTFALRMLLSAGAEVEDRLRASELDTARQALRSLVSRETSDLSAAECAAAATESLAENTTDSVLAPWLAYAVFGLPGAWAVRTLNTLDSRWGYHGRFEWLGRAAAVLDDAAAWVPSRLSAILLIAGMPAGGGQPAAALRAAVRDHPRTASPNAGWTMSAMAGGLGCRLEKRGQYRLNARGRDCSPDDVRRARRIVAAAAALALGAATCCRLLNAAGRRILGERHLAWRWGSYPARRGLGASPKIFSLFLEIRR